MGSKLQRHKKIDQINLDLVTMSPYLVSKKYGLVRSTVERYYVNEWKDIAAEVIANPPPKRDEKRDKKRAKLATQYQERQEFELLTGEEIVSSVQNAFREVDKILRNSVDDENKHSKLLAASRELRESAKTLLDFYIHARGAKSGPIADHPDWIEFRNRIADVLANYPGALDEIGEAEAAYE
jgi:hypothetical protein